MPTEIIPTDRKRYGLDLECWLRGRGVNVEALTDVEEKNERDNNGLDRLYTFGLEAYERITRSELVVDTGKDMAPKRRVFPA